MLHSESTYYAMVDVVWEFDREAALYLMEEAPNLQDFCYARLEYSFYWAATPQGSYYWNHINELLFEKNTF